MVFADLRFVNFLQLQNLIPHKLFQLYSKSNLPVEMRSNDTRMGSLRGPHISGSIEPNRGLLGERWTQSSIITY